MKKCIVALMLLTIFNIYNIHATYENNFAGSCSYFYSRVSTYVVKNNTSYLSGVNWTQTDDGNHRLLVQIRNSSGTVFGTKRIENKTKGDVEFRTTCSKNCSYALYASR